MGNIKTSIKEQKQIYHFTMLNNLDTIIQYGLLSRKDMFDRKLKFYDVADQEILDYRREHDLERFVPFHFFGNTPFDGAVRKKHPQDNFIYLAMSRINAEKKRFKILPKHPINMSDFKVYDYNEGIQVVDWDTMDRKDFNDHECKEICMAECIYDKPLYINDFNAIYVKDEDIQVIVKTKILENNSANIHVNLMPQWF